MLLGRFMMLLLGILIKVCYFLCVEFDKNFGEMLKNPIKNLIKRILQYAKNLYYKPKEYETASTQVKLRLF